MTHTSTTADASTTNQTTTTTTATATASEHYSIRARKHRERDPRATRSNASHLGITILGCGQACGLPRTTATAVDHAIGGNMIVSGWSWC